MSVTPRRSPIAITGLGQVSALGLGLDAMWAALSEGRDGIVPIERFDTAGFSAHLGGMVPLPGTLAVDETTASRARCVDTAVRAGREALERAKVDLSRPARVALVFGTSMGSHLGGLHEASAEVAQALGLKGPVVTVSTACASSTNALGVGRDLLDEGLADVVLAGGADVLVPEIFAGFHALGLLSPSKCAPFSERVGTTLGEGAGFLVLERAEDAEARGAPFVACLSGYALSADGYHATSPEPSGAGVARALSGTLQDAGLSADDIGYVNAHGTGTAANDPAEWLAISLALGPRAAQVPVSSTKSYLGHAQGAAGVLELIATLLALGHGQVLPTLHLEKPRRRAPTDPVAEPRPRAHVFEHALCTNSAFGGANAAVAVSRRLKPRAAVERRPVFITGLGALTPAPGSKRFPPFSLEDVLPTAETRGLDPSCLALTTAVALAVKDAKLALTGATRERTGLFVGTTNASPRAWDEFRGSISERGLVRCAAPPFTRLVLNAAAGVATRALGLRGPTTTLTVGEGSGLACLVLAAQALEARADADRLVVAAVDEVDLARDTGRSDGAGALVLSAVPGESDVRVAGVALAGPEALEAAIAQACARAGLAEVLATCPRSSDAVACGSLLSAVEGVRALRLAPGRVLITDVSIAASCAVVLERSASTSLSLSGEALPSASLRSPA